jgi:hypothetical protein
MSNPLNVIIVEKNGKLKSLQIKDFKEADLFKKCGFKSENNFQKETEWRFDNITVFVYGKKTGKPNTENIYEFPPPIDKTLFFGNCVLLAYDSTTKKYIDLSLDIWKEYYDKLFGGFENLDEIGDEDDDDFEDFEDEDDKDFIVGDNVDELETEEYV